MHPKDANESANSVDPDQSRLLQACASQNLGSVQYINDLFVKMSLLYTHNEYSTN